MSGFCLVPKEATPEQLCCVVIVKKPCITQDHSCNILTIVLCKHNLKRLNLQALLFRTLEYLPSISHRCCRSLVSRKRMKMRSRVRQRQVWTLYDSRWTTLQQEQLFLFIFLYLAYSWTISAPATAVACDDPDKRIIQEADEIYACGHVDQLYIYLSRYKSSKNPNIMWRLCRYNIRTFQSTVVKLLCLTSLKPQQSNERQSKNGWRRQTKERVNIWSLRIRANCFKDGPRKLCSSQGESISKEY